MKICENIIKFSNAFFSLPTGRTDESSTKDDSEKKTPSIDVPHVGIGGEKVENVRVGDGGLEEKNAKCKYQGGAGGKKIVSSCSQKSGLQDLIPQARRFLGLSVRFLVYLGIFNKI